MWVINRSISKLFPIKAAFGCINSIFKDLSASIVCARKSSYDIWDSNPKKQYLASWINLNLWAASCHGVCIMKWSKSVSFIRVGHFYTVNCLNLPGLPFNIVSANQRLTTSAPWSMTRVMMMQLSSETMQNRRFNWETSDWVSRIR